MNYEEISNNYYMAYKEELKMSETSKHVYSLNKIIKALFIVLSVVLTLLVSIYLKNNFANLSVLDIREEFTVSSNQKEELSSKLNITPQDLEILVELLKSQMNTEKKNHNISYTLSKNI